MVCLKATTKKHSVSSIRPSFCANINEKCTLELFRYLARGGKSGPKFHYKVTWNSVMGILLVAFFAILVKQHFAGFYFRDVKRQKKRLKSRWKSADKWVFTISFSCCFMGPTGISKHWDNIVLMMYFQVCINFQLKVYHKSKFTKKNMDHKKISHLYKLQLW